MKVLMFNKLYHPYLGGVERVVFDLCEELKNKVDLKVLAANTSLRTEVEDKDRYQIVRVASLGKVLSSVHLAPSIFLWWRRLMEESDIVHFHFPSPVAELYCLAPAFKKKPIVVSYHADIIGYSKAMFFYKSFLIKFLKRADRIIVNSPDMIEHSSFLKMFKHKCRIISHGIETQRFQINSSIKSKIGEIRAKFKKPIVLFVGRLIKYKGLDYLINAMKNINACLLIVGKGPQEKRLKSLAARIDPQRKKIFFEGEISDQDLPAYYWASEVFVLPSVADNEAFGLVQLEAYSCSKPVVSTALPTGVGFVNLDGQTGIVVKPKSSGRLAEAVNKLLHNSQLRQQLGRQAKARVESQFTRQIMAEKTLDLYRELLS